MPLDVSQFFCFIFLITPMLMPMPLFRSPFFLLFHHTKMVAALMPLSRSFFFLFYFYHANAMMAGSSFLLLIMPMPWHHFPEDEGFFCCFCQYLHRWIVSITAICCFLALFWLPPAGYWCHFPVVPFLSSVLFLSHQSKNAKLFRRPL